MSSDSKILVVLAAIAVLIGVGICYEMGTDDNGEEETGIVGHWYEVGFYGYDGETYSASDLEETSTLSKWDFTVLSYNEAEHSISAVYQHTGITGFYDGSYLSFRLTDDGSNQWLNLFVDGNMMYGVNCRADSGSSTKEFYVVYSTDRNAAASNPTPVDVSGTWQSDTATALQDGRQTDLGASVLTVAEQKGMVFRGSLTLTADGTALPVLGALTPADIGGYCQAYLVCDGENWNVLIRDGQIIAVTAAARDGTITAMERSYVREGGSSGEVDVPALTGQTWTYQGAREYYSEMSATTYYEGMQFTVTKQTGLLFEGTLCLGGNMMSACGFCYGGDRAMIGFYTGGSSYARYTYGTVADGLMELVRWFNTNRDSSTLFTLTDRAPLTDPTGYWLDTYMAGRGTDGKYVGVDYCDLNIFACRDGLFWGTYGGTAVSGTYEGGWLSFRATLADGTTTEFQGRFNGDRTLVANELRQTADGTCVAVTTVLSTQQIMYSYRYAGTSALTGTWTLADGGAYEFGADGKNDLMGSTIAIRQVGYGVFLCGTMAQQVDGKLAEKTFIGTLDDFGDGTTDRATVIDSGGLVYHLMLRDGVLYATAAAVTDSGAGGLAAIERTYTADGSTPALPDYRDLTGTAWQMKEGSALGPDGERIAFAGCTLTVDAQYRNTFSGTFRTGGQELTLVGALDPAGIFPGAHLTISDGTEAPMTVAIFDGKTLTLYGQVSLDGKDCAFTMVLTER